MPRSSRCRTSPQNQPSHLTVAEAEADQLAAGQDTGLVLCPRNRGRGEWFGAMHVRSLRILRLIVRCTPKLWKSGPNAPVDGTAAILCILTPDIWRKYTQSVIRPLPGLRASQAGSRGRSQSSLRMRIIWSAT